MSSERFRIQAACAVCLLLALLYFSLHQYGERLITKLPDGSVGRLFPLLFIVLGLLGGCIGYILTKPLQIRLLRRLAFIAIMALTMFAGANIARSVYSLMAFDTGSTKSEELLQIGASKAGSIAVISPGTGVAVSLTAELGSQTNAASLFGRCAAVQVETAPDGSKRIASDQPTIEPQNIVSC